MKTQYPGAESLGWPWTPSLKRAEGSKHIRAPSDPLQTKASTGEKKGNCRNSTGHSGGHSAGDTQPLGSKQTGPGVRSITAGKRDRVEEDASYFVLVHATEQLSSSHRGSHAGEGSRKTGKLSRSPTDTRCHRGSAQPPLRGSFPSCALTASAHRRACPGVRPSRPLPWLAQGCPNHPGLHRRPSLSSLALLSPAPAASRPTSGLLFSAAQQALPPLCGSSSCRS